MNSKHLAPLQNLDWGHLTLVLVLHREIADAKRQVRLCRPAACILYLRSCVDVEPMAEGVRPSDSMAAGPSEAGRSEAWSCGTTTRFGLACGTSGPLSSPATQADERMEKERIQ